MLTSLFDLELSTFSMTTALPVVLVGATLSLSFKMAGPSVHYLRFVNSKSKRSKSKFSASTIKHNRKCMISAYGIDSKRDIDMDPMLEHSQILISTHGTCITDNNYYV